jgi:quercetin dioxygenase-like cupin family protein
LADVLIVGAGTGERLGRATVLASNEDLSMFEYSLEPGTEPGGPHYHERHADSFYVLEGELEFRIDRRSVRTTAGSLIMAPRGAVHAFPVAIGGPARFLNLHTPGGFDGYLRELVGMRERGEEPNTEFLRSHDIHDA